MKRGEALHLDVANDASLAQAIGTVLAREGRLDVLVNNAGFGIAGAIEDKSIDEARKEFEVNFFGVVRTCRAALPAMRQQKAGYIVNIGSIGGLIAIPFQGFYSASASPDILHSKTALDTRLDSGLGLSRSL